MALGRTARQTPAPGGLAAGSKGRRDNAHRVGIVETDLPQNGQHSDPSLANHPAVLAAQQPRPVILEGPLTHALRMAYILGTGALLVVAGLLANALLLVLMPLRLLAPHKTHRLNALVTLLAWTATDYMFARQGNLRLTMSGTDALARGGSAYVLSNHVFFGDPFLLHAMAARVGMMPYCRYFLKDSIKYIPVFGWGMWLFNFVFLKRDWARDSGRISAALAHIVAHRLPVWLVSYPEGSRLTPAKLAASRAFAAARPASERVPVLRHVLLPRPRGFLATVRALRASHVSALHDVTLAFWHEERGFGAAPSVWEVARGRCERYRIHMHVDVCPLSDVPLGDEDATRFLYDRFVRKDALLEVMRLAFERSSAR